MSNPYQVLARKWRPQTFEEVVGQQHVVQTLQHAIEQNRVHHAYLLTGTRGVGKTTLSRIIAKCLNCETANEHGLTTTPCNRCNTCISINQGRFIDLLEIDAASKTKVEDTRELLDNVQYAPTQGRTKIYLIDEVHMLSNHSFNALLKTLEEPPAHVKFILATTDPQKLPITILSRCLQFHLKNLDPEQISTQLQHILTSESIIFENTALELISTQANGSMRDALSLLDQAISFGAGQVNTDTTMTMLGSIDQQQIQSLLSGLSDRNAVKIFETITTLAQLGANFTQVLDDLLSAFYQLSKYQQITELTPPATLTSLIDAFSPDQLQLYYQSCLIGKRDLALAPHEKLGFEMLMLRLLHFSPASVNTPIKQTPITPPTKVIHQPTQSHQQQSTTTEKQTTSQPSPDPQITTASSSSFSNSLNIENWHQLITELPLSPPTLALAKECYLIKQQGKQITLGLKPTQAALKTTQQETRLSQAISQYFQQDCTVSIQLINQPTESSQETPRQIENNQLEKKKTKFVSQLIEKINDNPHIKDIINEFEAKIVPESIQFTEKNHEHA